MDCPRCLLDDSIEGVTVSAHQCNICDAHDEHTKIAPDPTPILNRMRGSGPYDCVLGISGGLDSTWLVMWAYQNGLNPLLVHFDNHFNAPEANRNIERVVEVSGFPFVRVYADWQYRQACKELLKSGLPDVDIANDMAMAAIVIDVAKMYGIKWCVNGHHYRTEGWNPIGWTYMDGLYLRSIAGALPRYMDYGVLKQFRGIRQGRLYDYIPHRSTEDRLDDVRRWCGFEWYGGKHAENLYTEWVGKWYLPHVHGIDKRLNYLSAEVRSGDTTYAQAVEELSREPEFGEEKWERLSHMMGYSSPEAFREWVRGIPPRKDRSAYKSYRTMFRRFRPLMWIAMKMNMIAPSFYRKYCVGR